MTFQPSAAQSSPPDAAPAAATRLPLVALLALLAIATRLQFLGNPLLDSDEGFYLLVGDRMAHGALPYVDIWDRKPFGLFLLYAGMRMLGGDGVLAYQLVGTMVAFGAALLVARIALEFSDEFGAAAAAAAYLLWLPLGSAAGGQAELFFNLPLAGAALLTLQALRGRYSTGLWLFGAAAMLLVGIAIQIKYTALFTGFFLGLCWMVADWRSGRRAMVVLDAASWVLAALAPTLLAAAWYQLNGALDAFVYANFISIWGRGSASPLVLLGRLAGIMAVLAPLLACIRRPSLLEHSAAAQAYRFTLLWLVAAAVGLLLFGTYSIQYVLPLIAPACALAGPAFSRWPRRYTLALLGVALVAGQIKLAIAQSAHGSRGELEAVLSQVDHRKCLFVYSGFASLYRLAGTCIPTRFAFPSHLSREHEAAAIGVDPAREVERIMRTAPGTVIVRSPFEGDENWAARAVLFRHLHERYHLVLDAKLGEPGMQVYRLGQQTGEGPRS
jgi:hypothetical protein